METVKSVRWWLATNKVAVVVWPVLVAAATAVMLLAVAHGLRSMAQGSHPWLVYLVLPSVGIVGFAALWPDNPPDNTGR